MFWKLTKQPYCFQTLQERLSKVGFLRFLRPYRPKPSNIVSLPETRNLTVSWLSKRKIIQPPLGAISAMTPGNFPIALNNLKS